MRSSLQQIEQLTLDQSTNLWSYICLKGASIISLRWRDKEREYVKKKKELLEEICRTFGKTNLQHVEEILNQVKEALIANGYQVKVCRIKAVSRIAVGISEPFGQVPFEIGLFFDPILNVPFIPASSLKGAFRHALADLIERELKQSVGEEGGENIQEKTKGIVDTIFGSEKWSGLVGVTDAYPIKAGINGLIFEPDVITPHYPDAKTELDVEPKPVLFLTIARDVEFKFFIYFNKRIYELEHNHIRRRTDRESKRKYVRVEIVDKLKRHEPKGEKDFLEYAMYRGDLEKALENIQERDLARFVPWVDRAVLYAFAKGIGAKTSIGYSRFIVVKYTWA